MISLDQAARLGIALAPVTKDDEPFLRTLYASTRAAELAITGWPDALKAQFCDMQFSAQHAHYMATYPAAQWLLIVAAGDRIGRLIIDESGTTIRLIDIALMPRSIGKGVGSAVLGDLQTHASGAEKSIMLHVEAHNPAQRLYSRLGFVMHSPGPVRCAMTWPRP